MNYHLARGAQIKPQKVVIYGPEGIGKSTFLTHFPTPVFIDTEGSTAKLDVLRTPKPESWEMLLGMVRDARDGAFDPWGMQTLAIDTADWAESLCAASVCSKYKVSGIEDFGYGKGYTYLEEEFGRLLNLLQEVIDRGYHVAISAHSALSKFEQPDAQGAYDRYSLKLEKKTASLLKEWADTLLFANYETIVYEASDGMAKKHKASGQTRVMYTTHNACWDAKNRDGLAEKLPFDYAQIAPYIPLTEKTSVCLPQEPVREAVEAAAPVVVPAEPKTQEAPAPSVREVPKSALAQLMQTNGVKPEELQAAVAFRGFYPGDTPIANYDPEFVDGVLIAAWDQVFGIINRMRGNKE